MDSMKTNIDQVVKGVIIFVSVLTALFIFGFFLWATGHTSYKVKYLTGDKSGTIGFVAEQSGYSVGDTVVHNEAKIVIVQIDKQF